MNTDEQPQPAAPAKRKPGTDRNLIFITGLALAALLMLTPLLKVADVETVTTIAGGMIACMALSFIGAFKGAGAACMAAGALLVLFFAVIFPTAVATGSGAVNNIGLMNDRLIGVIVGIGLGGIGAVLHLKKK